VKVAMSDDNLTQLLAKRAPKPRSKSTTVLICLLILLVGVLLGGAIGKGAAGTQAPSQPSPAAPAPRVPGDGVRGTVDAVDGGRVTLTTDDPSGLAPGDDVVILTPPAGPPPSVSP